MYFLCLGWLCLTLLRVPASPGPLGQQRYLIYNIWTWTTAPDELAQFKAQADSAQRAGFNAIKVHVSWALCETQPGVFDFTGLDERLDYVVKTLRLPVAIYLDLTRSPILAQPDLVVNPNELLRDAQGNLAMNWIKRPMISLASTKAMTHAAAFVAEATRHCERRCAGATVLFYEPVFSPYAETEYFPDAIYDYSTGARDRYRVWLAARFKTVATLNAAWGTTHASFAKIEPPNNFDGATGLAWYGFRHTVLKAAIDRLADTIHATVPGSRVSIRFGSVFDGSIVRRGTVAFPDLCTQADIVFVDDAPAYPHPWSMDLLRGSLPGKRIGNEVDGPSLADDATYAAQIRQSFEHGAQFVTVANWSSEKLDQRRKFFQEVTSQLLPQSVASLPATIPTLRIDASSVFRTGYQEWQNQYQALSTHGATRINVVLDTQHFLKAINP